MFKGERGGCSPRGSTFLEGVVVGGRVYPEECLQGRDPDQVGGCGRPRCPLLPGGAGLVTVTGERAWWLRLQGVSALPHAHGMPGRP